ncbi:MAG: HD domain-containing protein [Candidatus Paceibacterota bacterium]|jgi:5'-deoxynucleotidase YfbR-like HD superfamily hydrolase
MSINVPESIWKKRNILYKGKFTKVLDHSISCPCAIGQTHHHPSEDLLMVELENIGTVPFFWDHFNLLELKYAKLFPDLWKALDEIPREGWVRREVKNPETDQEHTISLRNLVISMIDRLTEFSVNEILELLDMLEVHEFPEIIDGDKVIVTYDQKEKERLKAEKFNSEFKAMIKICKDLPSPYGKEIFFLWLRFEKGKGKVPVLARQLDKYQAMEKAFEYQNIGWPKVLAKAFIDYSRDVIIHPVLKEKMLNIEKQASIIF